MMIYGDPGGVTADGCHPCGMEIMEPATLNPGLLRTLIP